MRTLPYKTWWTTAATFALLLFLLWNSLDALAAGPSTDVTYHQVIVWTGLPDAGVHSIVVMKNGFDNEQSRPPVVLFGSYGYNDDVEVELTATDNGWEGDVAGLATVTVSYDSSLDAHLSVSEGTLLTEQEYLGNHTYPPGCYC